MARYNQRGGTTRGLFQGGPPGAGEAQRYREGADRLRAAGSTCAGRVLDHLAGLLDSEARHHTTRAELREDR